MKNKKRLSIFAGILIVIGIVGSLASFHSTDPVPVSDKKVISNNTISNVMIDTDNARVNIYPSKDKNIKVTLEGKVSANIKRLLTTNVKGKTLRVTYNEKQLSWFNFDFTALRPLTLAIYLPEKQYESVGVKSDNGYVTAESLNTTHAEIHTDNGRVFIRDSHTQTMTAESNNGLMNLTNIKAQSVQLKTDNGRLNLDHVDGKLEGESHNGSISLITKDLDRTIDFTTDNGRITIKTEKDPTNVQFNVSVDNGKINILNKYTGNAVIGKGKNSIQLTSHNGSISVQK
ncbi:DUF4097 family beta strand repeat-containing protein [Pullulanibacillus sp. KACC 23026]|uniref:DUF4097 family beta strand repeat-containing protein n=1 Tax=Pullulanibacillus sp. KACC 23026 TaxID=3028315 RepID=UPI0023B045CD|nr:DUF4097 family beta strand repeat-containing protein [Pullulanibacillus sp. KACC 23026]WEG13230.1 DUF4097 family beta strand repeat-containing protein [Pullulanibacillus sp. KACC 23026]